VKLNLSGGFSQLEKRLNQLGPQSTKAGYKWAERCARSIHRHYLAHLATQGRGGQGPDLSDLTKEIYRQAGEPDGSGIRNHIEIVIERKGRRGVVAIWGILEGKPSMVARVQDRGATIRVTQKMRGFMAARYGIFLRRSTKVIVIPGRRGLQSTFELAKRLGSQGFKP